MLDFQKHAAFRSVCAVGCWIAVFWLVFGFFDLVSCFGQDATSSDGNSSEFVEQNDEDLGGAIWREPNVDSNNENPLRDAGARELSNAREDFVGPKTTRYSYELSRLPDGAGQFWIVYDISPYSRRFPNLKEPQNSIVNWILFDSGKDFWRKEPFGVLSATSERLYVYHNAKIQRYVSNIVDRFIDPTKRDVSFSVKVYAVQNPDWRVREARDLAPASVTIEGNGADVQAWTVDREKLPKIIADLERRQDRVVLTDSQNVVPNGGTFGWGSSAPKKTFSRDFRADSSVPAGYASDVSSIDEGRRIETTPLLSIGGEVFELSFRYQATVVERMKTFSMRVSTESSPRAQLTVERPEIASCDISGKISVPRSKAAIIDLGMVPFVGGKKESENGGLVESVSNIVSSKSAFYDVVIFVDRLN
ncbi:MAG: hypothetical protein IJM30_05570 [Thermoguttaceae bacterium]|nr:hypothetical protein [Thermoguttaceae bacterium]